MIFWGETYVSILLAKCPPYTYMSYGRSFVTCIYFKLPHSAVVFQSQIPSGLFLWFSIVGLQYVIYRLEHPQLYSIRLVLSYTNWLNPFSLKSRLLAMFSSSLGLCLTWAFVHSVVSPQFVTSNDPNQSHKPIQYQQPKKSQVSHCGYQEKSEMLKKMIINCRQKVHIVEISLHCCQNVIFFCLNFH